MTGSLPFTWMRKLVVKDYLSCVDTWKVFLEGKPKPGRESYMFVASHP
jgi:hypothetical protein